MQVHLAAHVWLRERQWHYVVSEMKQLTPSPAAEVCPVWPAVCSPGPATPPVLFLSRPQGRGAEMHAFGIWGINCSKSAFSAQR